MAVAEELSFTRAAQRLHIGQPPLSQQIQALEAEIGAVLLDRSRRSVRLTEAGRIFLEDAQRILALSAGAADTARRVERGEVGQLKIGFTKSTAFAPIFPQIINTYRKRYPNVNLVLREMSTMRQIPALADYSLDLGFIRPLEADTPPDLVMTTLQRHALAIVVPSNHRLARVARVPIEALRSEEFIMFPRDEGTTLALLVYRLCADAGFAPNVVMEAREAATIVGLVAAGCGISILPDLFSGLGINGARFRPIETSTAALRLVLAHRAHEASAIANAFVEIAKHMRN